ncbi:MAG: hypothetical protein U0990_10445 [Candidatus Nanopelagicales bacterium]|nr:hypothetical protein [Candidatus Nanopelagicales bacterium]MDZ4250493.1 hypothetical protein [Candidatus Nanopelagicales bacterium]
MPALQIRDFPDELARVLKARAARQGQSLSSYASALLRAAAQTPTADEFAERLRRRGSAGEATTTDVVGIIREERDAG